MRFQEGHHFGDGDEFIEFKLGLLDEFDDFVVADDVSSGLRG